MIDVRDSITMAAISQDIQYLGRYFGSLQQPELAPMGPVLIFCMAPYLSLVVHESDRALSALNQTPPSLTPLAKDIVARSRHSLKLFEDTHKGVAGQLGYFRDEIGLAHSRRFLGNTWLWIARFLETDLGLYLYAGLPISSTHVANFHIGYPPAAMFTPGASAQVREISTEYGEYVGALGARLDSATSFASHLDRRALSSRDVRAARYYPRKFNGNGTPDLNALLTAFRMEVNFVDFIVLRDNSAVSWQTTFKIRYLTVYQVLRSLEILRTDHGGVLTPASLDALDRILGTADAKLIVGSKPLRNTLMHYRPAPGVPASALDPTARLYGLVEALLPGHTPDSLETILKDQSSLTARILNSWGDNRRAGP